MMRRDYDAPGLYVEPLRTGPAPIRSLATAVLALIAFTNSPQTVEPKLRRLNRRDEVDLLAAELGDTGRSWPWAAKGYFENGGRHLDVVTLPFATAGAEIDGAINLLKNKEDVTLLAFPELAKIVQEGPTEGQILDIQKKLISHCAEAKDRVVLLDVPGSLDADAGADRGPDEKRAESWADKLRENATDLNKTDFGFAALYYPWLKVKWTKDDGAVIPASGHIAGVMARVDSERGVHKAPANELIRGFDELSRDVSTAHQKTLNPKGVNCIRVFPDGIKVWGARTLDADDDMWRYINVRRLVCSITESVVAGTRWAVFEPNGPVLWAALRRDITAYLREKWQEGALAGRTPDQAFFVKCDETNNPREEIEAGICQVDIGVAPARPAEFIVLRIGQSDSGARIASLLE